MPLSSAQNANFSSSATPKKHSSSICTTTLSTLKTYNLSPVTTVYLTTHTATASVDCHGCSLTEVGIGGPGPVRPLRARLVLRSWTPMRCLHRHAFPTLPWALHHYADISDTGSSSDHRDPHRQQSGGNHDYHGRVLTEHQIELFPGLSFMRIR